MGRRHGGLAVPDEHEGDGVLVSEVEERTRGLPAQRCRPRHLLGDVADRIEGGSTGTWAIQEGLEREVPLPLIYTALAERFGSRADGRFSRRLANRLRYGFGRHEVPRRE